MCWDSVSWSPEITYALYFKKDINIQRPVSNSVESQFEVLYSLTARMLLFMVVQWLIGLLPPFKTPKKSIDYKKEHV